MSRVHAEALALVNWRGVFYERFELDRHVTGLEGDNGAGKTTVMIAAYVVLLPDMTRLRFTNLGETGATGGDKGIWGRLGESGRPSYAVLDFRLPRGDHRLLAGVHLERKGEPTVEPTPFIVTGLARDVRLQDILLLTNGELDQVPERDELRDNVARCGGRIEWFASARDYFARLFELGVTPLKLGTDEERNKLNEMLRTSMTGGMSRGLLTELRSFLLKEEGGLADTLQRMRANLDACRRTRTEVQEAQRLEQEIGAVYQAGDAMFATAVAGNRQRAEEVQRRVQEAELRHRTAEEAALGAEHALSEARGQAQAAGRRKEETTQAWNAARAWATQVEEAVRWAGEVRTRRSAMADATARYEAAQHAGAEAERAFAHAQTRLSAASEGRERAAAGLADLEQGLEELYRQADAHQRVRRRLGDAQRLLQHPSLRPDDIAGVRADAEKRLADVDDERRATQRRLADADRHREEHAAALAALATIPGDGIDMAEPLEAARAALVRVDRWSHDAEQRGGLNRDLRAAEAEAGRQAHARDRAAEAGLAAGSGSAAVAAALNDIEAALADGEQRARQALVEAAEARRSHEVWTREVTTLEAQSAAFHALAKSAARVAEAVGRPLVDRGSLDETRSLLHERRAAVEAHIRRLTERHEDLSTAARELVHAGGSFPDELLRMRDDLGAELLAPLFDDAAPGQAAELEARLGHLAQALIVADLDAAIDAARARPDGLPTLWLVPEGTPIAQRPETIVPLPAGSDVVVQEDGAHRITRVPHRPTLGRAARKQRAEEMLNDAETLLRDRDAARHDARDLATAIRDADALLEGIGIWLAGDVAAAIGEAQRQAAEATERADAASTAASRAAAEVSRLRPRHQLLRDLLPEGHLLDAPDGAKRVAELRLALEGAEQAAAALARAGGAPATLRRLLDALRHPPLGDAALRDAQTHLASLDADRDALAEAIEAVDYVAQHADALRWTDAADRLAERRGLVPALSAQLDAAKELQREAQEAEAAARASLDTARLTFNERDAQRARAAENLSEATDRLAATGVDDPSEALLVQARAQVANLQATIEEADRNLAALQRTEGAREAALETAQGDAVAARRAEEDERRQARPAIDAWERLRPQIEAAGLLTTALAERLDREFAGRGSVNLFPAAQEQRAVLFERLRTAMGGRDVLEQIERPAAGSDVTGGEAYLHVWLAVRAWLLARLPAHIADVDEPLVALARFRDHLGDVVERLERQERDLLGTSADVARGIDVQVRKARGRAQRLNEHLRPVAFGSIRGIRVRMTRVERMHGVLEALRSGDAQGLLFESTLPIEEALDRIIQQYAGGRSGGQKLLDYREYLHLEVEVRRRDDDVWEGANPTRLSTGEAIGVGAALMMVVLTEWEHDANLLRGQRSFGSMRFLFLDEANRLDDANFGTVLDLCRHLDLQLLVAAPDVARAEGCTVYRLTRGEADDGRETVLVSGRRAVARVGAGT
jgi:chromosome partition protein MukB